MELQMYGEVDGILKDALDNTSTKTELSNITKPIVMSGKTAQNLGAGAADLKSAFDKGIPVVIANPGNDLSDLHKVLGTKLPGKLGNNVAVYAIDCEPNGDLWQITLYDSNEVAPKVILSDLTPEGGKEVKYAEVETEEGGLSNVIMEDLNQWLSESQKRDEVHQQRLDNSDIVSDSSQNKLTELASKFVDTFGWYLGNLSKPNSLVVNTFAYSCYTEESQLNWFLIEQYCVFSASNLYTTNTSTQQGWYAQIYGVNSFVNGYEGAVNQPHVNLIQSSPPTTTGSQTVTSGVSYSLSGTVSYSKKAGVGGSVTGGMTVSNSTTVSIPDVNVANDVNNVNNANWTFTMPCCSGVEDGCVNSISAPKTVEISTFQPMNTWIWQVDNTVRSAESAGLPLKTVLSNRLINTYINDCNIFGCDCDVNQQQWNPADFDHLAYIPFPAESAS